MKNIALEPRARVVRLLAGEARCLTASEKVRYICGISLTSAYAPRARMGVCVEGYPVSLYAEDWNLIGSKRLSRVVWMYVERIETVV